MTFYLGYFVGLIAFVWIISEILTFIWKKITKKETTKKMVIATTIIVAVIRSLISIGDGAELVVAKIAFLIVITLLLINWRSRDIEREEGEQKKKEKEEKEEREEKEIKKEGTKEKNKKIIIILVIILIIAGTGIGIWQYQQHQQLGEECMGRCEYFSDTKVWRYIPEDAWEWLPEGLGYEVFMSFPEQEQCIEFCIIRRK